MPVVSDDALIQAMQQKSNESDKAKELFRQMHKMIHDEMAAQEPPKETTMVKLESSCEPS